VEVNGALGGLGRKIGGFVIYAEAHMIGAKIRGYAIYAQARLDCNLQGF
jgi:hypothetical protein